MMQERVKNSSRERGRATSVSVSRGADEGNTAEVELGMILGKGEFRDRVSCPAPVYIGVVDGDMVTYRGCEFVLLSSWLR